MGPCGICNTVHKGADLGHLHVSTEGVGYIRLLVLGQGAPEYCWRCSCRKSGWRNVPNAVSHHCADWDCLCHKVDIAD